jgi:uncharacterized protein (UPF0147 family)
MRAEEISRSRRKRAVNGQSNDEAKMVEKQQLDEVVDFLGELLSDNTVPRNIKMKIDGIIRILRENCEVSIRVNKALNDLDEITSDVNLQPYTRTQLWSVVSMLEKA